MAAQLAAQKVAKWELRLAAWTALHSVVQKAAPLAQNSAVRWVAQKVDSKGPLRVEHLAAYWAAK